MNNHDSTSDGENIPPDYYAEDDTAWKTYKVILTEVAPHITAQQKDQIDSLICDARVCAEKEGKLLPKMQACFEDLDETGWDEDADGSLQVEWNVQGSHHFSISVEPDGEAMWMYVNHSDLSHVCGDWSVGEDPSIPEDVREFLLRVSNVPQ